MNVISHGEKKNSTHVRDLAALGGFSCAVAGLDSLFPLQIA